MDAKDSVTEAPEGRKTRGGLKAFLYVVVPIVVALLAGYILYAEARAWRKTHYPVFTRPASLPPGVKGLEAKEETERLGKPGSPVVVRALLPPASCADGMRGLLHALAAKHGEQGLYVEIYNRSTPEGRKFGESQKADCATVWVNDTEILAKHGGDPAGIQAVIEKALEEAKAKKKVAPSGPGPQKGT